MRRVLLIASWDGLIPLFVRLSRALEARGVASDIPAFLPRERLWLAQLGVPDPTADLDPDAPTSLTEAEAVELAGFMRVKHGGSEAVWAARVARTATLVEQLMDRHAYDAVVVWNGQEYLGGAAAELARRRGIRTIFLENGYLPRTLQADPEGVNSNTRIGRLSYDEVLALPAAPSSEQPVDPAVLEIEPPSRFVRARSVLTRKTDRRYYDRYPEQRGSSGLQKSRLDRERRAVPVDDVTLPERYAFLPLQVHDDTQILLNSPHVQTMEEWVRWAHGALRRALGSDIGIVVKEHPEDIGRIDYSALRADLPDVLWLRNYPIDEVLDHAALVLVINSSVGYQALVRETPVVTFGHSPYAKPELVFPVVEAAGVDALVAAAGEGMDAERAARIRAFDDQLGRTLFVDIAWRDPTPEQLGALADRIEALGSP